MAIYRTAQGKRLDMSILVRKNEKVRAVGNMSVNARGDTIDSQGRVVVPVTKKVGDKYQRTVSNRSAKLKKREQELFEPIETSPAPESKLGIEDEIEIFNAQEEADALAEFELTPEELEIDDLAEFEVEIEEIKAKEVEKSKKK